MKKQVFLAISISLMILSGIIALPVRGATYSPGVKPSDYVTFNHISYVANGTLPPNYGVPSEIASLQNLVTTVSGNDVTLQQMWTFNNASNPRSDIVAGNVQTGVGNLTLDVISGGLSAGDPVFQTTTPTPFPGQINETVTRSYVGALRNVNVLTYTFVNSGPYLFRVAAYLDAATGFLLEIYEFGHLPNGPSSSVTFSFDAYVGITNAWSPSSRVDYSLDSLPGMSTQFPPGGSVGFGVNLTSYNGFAGTVTVDAGLIASNASITNHPVVSPATSTLTLAASKSSTEVLTVTSTSSTPFGLYIISINATFGSTFHNARLTVRIVSPTPDFTIDANPISLNILQGSSQNSTVTLTSLNGLSGTVSILTRYDSAHLAVSPSYTSVVLASGGTASFQLKIEALSNAPVGPYQVVVTGYFGTTTFHSVTITPTVTTGTTGNFSISADPVSLIIPQGHAKYTNVTLASLNGLSGDVSIGYDSRIRDAVDIGASSITLVSGGSEVFRVEIYVPLSTPVGNYYLNVSGTAQLITQTVKIPVQVVSSSLPGFNITITPASQSVMQGSAGTATVRLRSLNGFQGTVTLKSFFSNLPTNFSPTSITLSAGQALDSTLTISPSNSVTPGLYPVDVEGQTNSTGAYDSIYTDITVTTSTQPNFSLTPTSTTITVVANSIATDNLRVDALNGFTGTVSFIRVASLFEGVSYYCSSVTLTSTTTSGTSNCIFSSSTPGTYNAIVNGTGGSPAVSNTVTYTVNVIKASPAISTTLSASTITVGDSVTDSATLTGTDILTAGGTVTFQFFTGSTCTGTPTVVGSPIVVTYGAATSQPQTFSTAGAFSWNAAYSGDSANNRSTSTCEPLTVNTPIDYTLTANPTTASITAGSTFTATITATLTNGVAVPVTLIITNSPNPTVCLPVSGVSPCGTFSLSPITITPTSAGATSTLTVATTATVPPGIYTLTIAGLPSGTSSASATITLTVTAAATPDLTISANSTPISATTGSPATSTVTVSAVHGFTGTVTLSISAPSGITCTLDHTTLQGYGTATLTCTSNTPNDYTVMVTAAGGASQHSTTQTFHVSAAPSPAAPAPSILGLSPVLFYGIIGLIIAAVIGGIAVVMRRRNP